MKNRLILIILNSLISLLLISCDTHLPGQTVSVGDMRRDAWKLEKEGRRDTCVNLLLKARVEALNEDNKLLADSIKQDINRIAKSDVPVGGDLETDMHKADMFYQKATATNQLMDSALFYNKKLVDSDNIFAQRRGHLGLLKIYLYLGNNGAACDELALYEMCSRLVEQSDKEKIAQGVFDHYNSKRNLAYNKDLNGIFNWMFLALGLLFILLIAAGYISWLIIRNKDQREQLLQMRIQRMRQLQHDYEKKDKEIIAREQRNIESSDIYQTIKQRLNSPGEVGCLSAEEWRSVGEAIRRIYPDFDVTLTSLCKMSKHEFHVCQLLKMNIAPSAIGELTAHSKEAITSTRRRLYTKVFGRKGTPKEWDDLIKSIS